MTPRANAGDWELTQDLLGLTLQSLAAQTDGDFRVLIAGHERPRLPADARVEFFSVDWAPAPTGPHNDDSGRKKHLLSERIGARGGGLMMIADADDWVDRRTVETARRELASGGWHGGVITAGDAVDLATLRACPIPAPGVWGELHRVCGTSTVTVLRPDARGEAERDPFAVLRSHHAWLERAAEHGLKLRRLEVGAAYVVGTTLNHSAVHGEHPDWFQGFRRALNARGAPVSTATLERYGQTTEAVTAVSARIAARVGGPTPRRDVSPEAPGRARRPSAPPAATPRAR